NLKMLGEYYKLYADLMEHWKKTLDIKIIELEYEKVIANPEDEMRNLLEQCGIEWDPACLKFHENKRAVMTPSYDQVRRPIYNSSVVKWKKYEQHLGDLIGSLGERAY
ncbi:MAG: sulfotransferase, partial [Gammaproteobacteria bacterium]|nr:sulfotransferase [Gammaproteobacteria bacterium]